MAAEHRLDIASLAALAAGWWRRTAGSPGGSSDLERLADDEVAALSREMGVSVADLHQMARLPSQLPELLQQRLQSLALDASVIADVSPLVLADLQRTCCSCADKALCTDRMRVDPGDPAWRDYCPNAPTLDALKP